MKIFKMNPRSVSLFFGVVVSFFLICSLVWADWDGPGGPPPTKNVERPLHVGEDIQAKSGPLGIGGVFQTNSTTYLAAFGGYVGIGTNDPGEKLEVGGNILADAYYYSSDVSLKKNVAGIDSVLDKVLSLEGISFEWKDEEKNSGENLGLVAQDVERVFPEIVSTGDNGLKSVQYGNLVAPLIEAVKEQQLQIEELRDEIEKMRREQ